MFKNKFIIAILSFYILWIGVLPLVLTKTVKVVCKNISVNSSYTIQVESPKVKLYPIPLLKFSAEEIIINSKKDSSNIELSEFKLKLRLLPLLSGKIHINNISVEKLSSSLNMKKRFELDKQILNKIRISPLSIDSIRIDVFDSKFYHQDVKIPVVYKGKNFIFQRKNRYIKFTNQSAFSLAGKTSEININLCLPKDNDFKKTVFDIEFSNFDLAPLKIYLKQYLPSNLLDLKGDISARADKRGLVATFSNCKIFMKDSAQSIIFPEKMVIKSKFNIKRQFIDFEEINIDSQNISISMDGKVFDYFGNSMPTVDFNIRVNKSRVEDLVKILPAFRIEELDIYKLKKYKFYADLLANFSIKGRLPEPDVVGNVYIDDGILIKPIPKTSNGATIKLTFKGRSLDFDVVVPVGGLEKVFVNGSQDLYNTKYAKFAVKSTKEVPLDVTKAVLDPLHEILNFIIGPLPMMDVLGKGNIDILVKGNRKNPHIWGELNFNGLTAVFNDMNELKLEDAVAKLTFADQNVSFITQEGHVNGKDFKITGISDLFGKFDFNILTNNQPTKSLYEAVLNSKMVSEYKKILPKLCEIKGSSDWALKIYGTVKTLDDIKINQNVFIKGDIVIKNNEFDFEGVRISKANGNIKLDSNNIDIDLSAITGESSLSLLAKIKNNIADVVLKIPRLNPNKVWKENFSGKYLLPFVSLDLNYKGTIDKIEYEKLNLVSKVLESNPKSALKFDSGKFVIENNKIIVADMKGYIDNIKNAFDIDLKANNAFNNQINVNGSIKMVLSDLGILSEISQLKLIPPNIKCFLKNYKFNQGQINIDAKVSNNNINTFTNLSGVSLTYSPLELPINVINGTMQIKNNNLSLNKINMLADDMPILIDGEIKDILNKQNFNIYINSKPHQEFIDKYINRNRVYPIKIKGDIVCKAWLKGNIEDFDLKTNLNLSKESSIYYLGALVGDIENAIDLDFDSKIISGKVFKIKDFSYNKLIDSQSGRQTQLNMLKAWGGIDLSQEDVSFKDLHVKTQNPTDARIFNIIFRKPNIKQGQFTSDLKFNGKLSEPKVIGDFHIFETNIPFFDTTMKNIELVFKDKTIDVTSKGEVMGNDLSFKGTLKNKLSQPYYLEKGILYTKDLDLNRIFEKLKISQVDDISTFESFDDFKLSSIAFKNLKFKADNIRLRNIEATNYEAITSLNDKGLFEVNKFVFNIAQGALNGNYRYNLKTNDMSLNLDANKISADDIILALFDLRNQIYGDMTGQINLSCNGTNFERCMQTLEGNSIFNVKDGRMPKLGSLEYLLKAGNLVKGGLTGLSINSVIELITPLKTGEFSDIFGSVRIKDGIAQNLEITTKGKDLSLFVAGTYNFATSEADMEVYGMLSRKMSSFFGPIGNLSINTLFNVIPGVDLAKDSTVLEKINKIPGIELSSKDFRKFIADIKGNINGEGYVTSFKWIN